MKTLTEFSVLFLRKVATAKTARAAEALEGDALREAIGTDAGCSPERAGHALTALEVVGDNWNNVRLVRVYQGETAPFGATTHGEFHFVIDKVAAPAKPARAPVDGERPRRDKPRGLSALRPGAPRSSGDDSRTERVNFRDIPKAGVGWQLTSAPRPFGMEDDKPRGKRPPRKPGDPRKPGGPRDPRNARGPRRDDRDGRRDARPADATRMNNAPQKAVSEVSSAPVPKPE